MPKERLSGCEKATALLKQDQQLYQELVKRLSPRTIQAMCDMFNDPEFASLAEQANLQITLATALIALLRRVKVDAHDHSVEDLINQVERQFGPAENDSIIFLQSQQQKRKTDSFPIVKL